SRQSLERLERRRDLQVGSLARVLGHQAGIEGMRCELDERVGRAMLETAVVSLAHGLREGLEGGAHGSSTNRVQLAADEKRPIVPDGELQAALFNRDSLLPGYSLRIERMAQAHAVVPQTTGRRFLGSFQELSFYEHGFRSRLCEGAC